MKILVTGSTGNLGTLLVNNLINNGHEIIELTRNIKKSQEKFSDKTIKVLIEKNQDNLKKKIKENKPEVCIHLASFLTSNDDFYSLKKISETNFLMLRILDSIKDIKEFKLFINTGSFSQYLKNDDKINPAYLYSAGKNSDLTYLKYYSNTYKFKSLSIVPYTIYGSIDSNKKIIDLIIYSLKSKQAVELTNGKQILDFTHINDVVKFYTLIIENYQSIKNESIIKFGTGVGTSIRDLAKLVEKVSSKKVNISWGAKKYRKNDVMKAISPKSSLTKEIEFTKLEDGLRNYIKILNNK